MPYSFRYPRRTQSVPLNLANLTAPPEEDYLLGANDVLEVTVPDLFPGAEVRPLRLQVMASGEIQLPLAGTVQVGGMNLLQAQQAITRVYADGILTDPTISVSLASENTIPVLVLGEVARPGIQELPKYQNDVGHALAAAGGFRRDAAEYIEVHRRVTGPEKEPAGSERADGGAESAYPPELERYDDDTDDPKKIIRIPMRGLPSGALRKEDVVLQAGDVVNVPSRSFDVFWVVGQLAPTRLAFSVGDRERELGVGLVLPRDRDIDVVTAVAMAGYIDPIDSPTTVTVHRRNDAGESLLIRVDLIAARYDPANTVLIQAGDIIYVNPDMHWWFRRQWDRLATQSFLIPYAEAWSKIFRP